uniref:Granulins domain-containing protein n=1 Tax=Mola mola TaxID=94237 RepID=A0A3Q3WGW6_MOLML
TGRHVEAAAPLISIKVNCDDRSQCPKHTTCCQLDSGKWGCCPLQNAVCCPDKQHCCPHGYTCDPTSTSCHKRLWVALTPLDVLGSRLRDVKCDEQTSCQDGQTCCRMSATMWGCCPYPNVCVLFEIKASD